MKVAIGIAIGLALGVGGVVVYHRVRSGRFFL